MKKNFLSVFLLCLGFVLLVPSAYAQTLNLNPVSGDSPTVTGTLSGSGWCGPTDFTPSGTGVSGSAAADASGNLSGNFSVRGNPGETITVEVSGPCPASRISLSARANFTFNTPTASTQAPTSTPSPTSVPTSTPSPIPTKSVKTQTSKVTLPPLLISSPIPTPKEEAEPALPVQTTLSGNTFLKLFRTKMEGTIYWVTDLNVYGTWKGAVHKFDWTTDLKNVDSGIWQVSILPFPADLQLASGKTGPTEADPLSPPGLVAKGEVNCANCEFKVDFYAFSTEKKEAEKNLFGWLISKTGEAVDFVKSKGEALVQLITQKKEPLVDKIKLDKSTYNPTDYLVFEKTISPFTYYIRVIPKYKGKVAGAPSNTVYLHWAQTNTEGEKLIETFKKCSATPQPEECKYKPPPNPYKVEILSYSPIVAPKDELRGCFEATQDIKIKDPFTKKDMTVYKQGELICPPKPEPGQKEPENFWDWLKQAVKAPSQAWNMWKQTFVQLVSDLVCPESVKSECKMGLAIALDAGMAAMGLPPTLPDFDALVKEGASYFSEQLAKQIGIPPVVTELTKKAQELKKTIPEYASLSIEEIVNKELEKMAAKSLEEAAKAVNLAKAQSSGYIPDYAAPYVKPYPDGWYKSPKIVIKITRKAEVKEDLCEKQGGIWKNSIDISVDGENPKPAGGADYATKGQLFENIVVPRPKKLTPGESKTITLPLELHRAKLLVIDGIVQTYDTTVKKYGDYFTLAAGGDGTAHFYASGGCADVASLDWPAQEFYPK